jgi:phosphoserine phosphatase
LTSYVYPAIIRTRKNNRREYEMTSTMTREEANEYIKRAEGEIKESFRRLTKAMKQEADSKKYLEINIAENKELGNKETANDLPKEHLQKATAEVMRIRKHITKIENYIKELQ